MRSFRQVTPQVCPEPAAGICPSLVFEEEDMTENGSRTCGHIRQTTKGFSWFIYLLFICFISNNTVHLLPHFHYVESARLGSVFQDSFSITGTRRYLQVLDGTYR